MDTGTKQGSVECPYCGHQIAERVKYAGQTLNCQKCTSACTAPTYSERLSPAYLAEKESKERKRNVEFEAAQKVQQTHYDDHFKWGSLGCAVSMGLYATGAFIAILMRWVEPGLWLTAVFAFLLFLWVLRSAVPQKYVSKEAMKRVERRQRDKQADNTTPVNPRDTGHE